MGQYDPMGEGAAAGAGLGLYLAHMYADAMGWTLELNSSKQGTRASVLVPLAPADTSVTPAAEPVLRSDGCGWQGSVQRSRVLAELGVWQARKLVREEQEDG